MFKDKEEYEKWKDTLVPPEDLPDGWNDTKKYKEPLKREGLSMKELIQFLKKISTGILKIAGAIIVVIVVIALFFWGYSSYTKKREAVKNAPLSEAKTWKFIQAGAALNNSLVALTSKWEDRKIYYQFTIITGAKIKSLSDEELIRKYLDAEQSKALGLPDPVSPNYTLIFMDSGGFKIHEFQIYANQLTRNVDNDGKAQGWSYKGDEYMDADTYRKMYSWDISWHY